MRSSHSAITIALTAVLLVSACGGNREPVLMNVRSATSGPDEFSVLPGKPLQAPVDYSQLPAPTPGGANITDPTPNADAVAALGGNPSALARTGVARADQGLVAHAGRYGISNTIRAELAAEDLAFRRKNNGRLLERLFDVNVYFKAYRVQSLDQHRELERFRSAGVRTPSAPPSPEQQ